MIRCKTFLINNKTECEFYTEFMDLHQPDEKGEVESRRKAVLSNKLPSNCKKRSAIMYVRDAETTKLLVQVYKK